MLCIRDVPFESAPFDTCGVRIDRIYQLLGWGNVFVRLLL
jgi:hypothetical protein